MENKWLAYAKRVQALAQAGITYAVNDYDLERYEELRLMSAKMIADLADEQVEKVLELFKYEVGYQTPKIDIRGVIFEEDKILLVQEKIDNCWSLPGGWADIGYSPKEVVVKEVKEESGLEVIAERLVALLDKRLHSHPPDLYHIYKMFISCQAVGGELRNGMETLDVGYFSLHTLPPLSTGRITQSQIEMLFKIKEGRIKAVVLD